MGRARRVMSVGMLPGVPGRRGGAVVAACRAIHPSVVSRFLLSVLILTNECKLQTLNMFSSVQLHNYSKRETPLKNDHDELFPGGGGPGGPYGPGPGAAPFAIGGPPS